MRDEEFGKKPRSGRKTVGDGHIRLLTDDRRDGATLADAEANSALDCMDACGRHTPKLSRDKSNFCFR